MANAAALMSVFANKKITKFAAPRKIQYNTLRTYIARLAYTNMSRGASNTVWVNVI